VFYFCTKERERMNDVFLSTMDSDISVLVRRAARVAWRYPAYLLPFYRLARRQAVSARLREEGRARGVPVPAFLIVSVTRRCNLRCTGCYSHAAAEREREDGRPEEMDATRLARVVREGAGLGVSFMLIAGGEPLVRASEVVALARDNPDVVFPVFTNGTLIDKGLIAELKRNRNLIPILSVEGGLKNTDGRRGQGVYGQTFASMRALSRAGIFFGVSFTVMRGNLGELTSPDFVASLVRAGVGVFFYNEYTPIEPGTESLCIDAASRSEMLRALEGFRRRFRAIFLAFPGDEDRFGGCLSAARGFAHVAPDGRLEACPFAPFGDTSARDLPLADALRSPMLAGIRAHHDELAETSGGCALWNRREWAESLAAEK
jgi:MoaA/NifB/PqqE/SkfB family radical SAM enzyme